MELVTPHTSMRPTEAKNLRWRDVDTRTDRQGRTFVVLKMRGKDKYRKLSPHRTSQLTSIASVRSRR